MYQQSSKCDFYRSVEVQTSIDQNAMKYARFLAIKNRPLLWEIKNMGLKTRNIKIKSNDLEPWSNR